MLKKSLSLLLVLVMIIAISSVELTVAYAQESNIAEQGATLDTAQEGISIDLSDESAVSNVSELAADTVAVLGNTFTATIRVGDQYLSSYGNRAVFIESDSTTRNQWKFTKNDNDTYYIQNVLNGNMLELIGSIANNAKLRASQYILNSNTRWYIIKHNDVYQLAPESNKSYRVRADYAYSEDYSSMSYVVGEPHDVLIYSNNLAPGSNYIIDKVSSYKYDTPMITSVTNTNNGVVIKWNKIPGVTKYRVYYETTPSWHKIGETTSNSFTYKKATDGEFMNLTIRGLDSNNKFVTDYDHIGTPHRYLDAPTFTLKSTSSGVKISWSADSGEKAFRVYRRNGDSWKLLKETNASTYTDTSVTSGTKYTYTVKCVKFYKENVNSAFSSKAITYNSSIPKISSISNGNSGVTIKWGKISGASKYRVFYKTGSSGWKKIADTKSTSYTHKNPKYGVQYTYTVRCVSSDGKKYTSGYDSNGKKNTLLKAPTIQSMTIQPDYITVKWNKISGATKYRFYYKVKGTSNWKHLKDTTSTTLNFSATNKQSYAFTVRCLNSSGTLVSGYKGSSYTTFYSAPTVYSASYTSTNKINLKWHSIKGVSKYRVFIKSGGSWKKLKDVTGTSYTATVSDPYNSHYFAVRCLSANGSKYISHFRSKYVEGKKSISEDEAIQIARDNYGFASGYNVFYFDDITKNSISYYVIRVQQRVADTHYSYLGDVFVSFDGTDVHFGEYRNGNAIFYDF